MALSDLFRRRPPVRNRDELADFIDRNAAFLIQKGLFEYARARAAHYAKVLFKEPEFQHAVDVARWRAFPLGLAMVAEVAYSVLSGRGEAHRPDDIRALTALVLAVFDRYPVPAVVDEATWRALRAELDQRLALMALHPPKRAMDVPASYAKLYFDLMPIHEKLRSRDLETTRSYLAVTLCNIHDELTRSRGDLGLAALARAS